MMRHQKIVCSIRAYEGAQKLWQSNYVTTLEIEMQSADKLTWHLIHAPSSPLAALAHGSIGLDILSDQN